MQGQKTRHNTVVGDRRMEGRRVAAQERGEPGALKILGPLLDPLDLERLVGFLSRILRKRRSRLAHFRVDIFSMCAAWSVVIPRGSGLVWRRVWVMKSRRTRTGCMPSRLNRPLHLQRRLQK